MKTARVHARLKEKILLHTAAGIVRETLKGTDFELKPFDIDMGLFLLMDNIGIKAVQGVLGFIQYSKERGMGREEIALHVYHDLVHSADAHFVPRTHRYHKHYKEAA